MFCSQKDTQGWHGYLFIVSTGSNTSGAAGKLATRPINSRTSKTFLFQSQQGNPSLMLNPPTNHTMNEIWDMLRDGGVFISETACVGDVNPLMRWVVLPAMQAVGRAPRVNKFTGGPS
ncbi:hypothetical protein J3458_000533 [Metarhizium acridum]|uniref:uncharacterized protein n=1 Tax=Metarhizium acridum TaxID=92637 RepID=UPI001C6A8F11|nr:hypothetical protein J3458_000533 [Metarhizium acridum]